MNSSLKRLKCDLSGDVASASSDSSSELGEGRWRSDRSDSFDFGPVKQQLFAVPSPDLTAGDSLRPTVPLSSALRIVSDVFRQRIDLEVLRYGGYVEELLAKSSAESDPVRTSFFGEKDECVWSSF